MHFFIHLQALCANFAEPSRTQLPVLVIVHGDDYGWNSGNPYNGTIIASFGQIIVVTLNYRLGVFGENSRFFRKTRESPLRSDSTHSANIFSKKQVSKKYFENIGKEH